VGAALAHSRPKMHSNEQLSKVLLGWLSETSRIFCIDNCYEKDEGTIQTVDCEKPLYIQSRTISHDNIKMILKWIGNDWKITFNDHFEVILIL